MLAVFLCGPVRAEQRAQRGQAQPLLLLHLALDQESGLHRLHLLQQGQPCGQLRDFRYDRVHFNYLYKYYISVTKPDRGSPDIYILYLAVSVSESV